MTAPLHLSHGLPGHRLAMQISLEYYFMQ
ncbi:unnamed protein product, partial [Didymodactylos carnosus]